jgi:hypothetical protein
MPPMARGAVGEIALGDCDGLTEGDCDGVTESDCDGVSAGDCEGVAAGVSEGAMLGGVRPDCGCAKAALASASNAAAAIDLRIIGALL